MRAVGLLRAMICSCASHTVLASCPPLVIIILDCPTAQWVLAVHVVSRKQSNIRSGNGIIFVTLVTSTHGHLPRTTEQRTCSHVSQPHHRPAHYRICLFQRHAVHAFLHYSLIINGPPIILSRLWLFYSLRATISSTIGRPKPFFVNVF